MKENHSKFDLEHVIRELKHFLPAQAPLKDFIHHNTLHAFQQESFHLALNKATKIFGYKTYLTFQEYQKMYEESNISKQILEKIIIIKKGKENINFWLNHLLTVNELNFTSSRIGSIRDTWKDKFYFDIDVRVHPFLFRLLGSYLDQGIAIWNFPGDSKDFMKSVRDLERNSKISLFKSKRVKKLLLTPKLKVESLLEILVGDEDLYEHYIFDQQFAHPGWSGIVAVIEDNPHTLLDGKLISLIDLIKLECLFEIDALDNRFGDIWAPISSKIKNKPVHLFDKIKRTEKDELKEIWQEAFEWTYYDQVLFGIKNQFDKLQLVESKKENETLEAKKQKKFQAIFCIDDRECSIRRHIEKEVPTCETFGTAGHFNVEFYFQPENGKFYTKVCPAPVTPKFLIKEFENSKKKKKDFHYNKQSHSLIVGWFLTHTIGLWSGIRLAMSIFRPIKNASTSDASAHMDKNSSLTIENTDPTQISDGLQIGFSILEMTDRVEGLLKSIGLVKDFAPLVYAVGHGSTSVNNTHYAGYDCGACSGRPGSVNARVISSMANNTKVRAELEKRGISISNETQFIGALHDTSRDEMSYFDVKVLSKENYKLYLENKKSFIVALDNNSKERSRRFVSINSNNSSAKIHEQVKTRTVSLFEPRPELNHATNALSIVGRRNFTKGVFLDRRSFLNSFDYRVDPEGNYLLNILNAVAPVCGGINLEYYFSRVDNHNLGAGTKLPHNVMGLIGVANGIDGDLRTGLPKQMIEVHDPIRLLVIVEHFPEIVLKTIKRNPATYNWFEKDWVKLVACNPETNDFYEFKEGEFIPYHLVQKSIETLENFTDTFEKEIDNLPVFLINN